MNNHKIIILCEDHYNPLTLVRSLALDNFRPIIVLIGSSTSLVPSSKFAEDITHVATAEEGLEYIISKYGQESEKPFLFTCDDSTETLIDANYSRLKDKFIFFNGGEDGRVADYMDKEAILLAAKECGIDIPESERVPHGQLPKKVPYPLITKSIRSTEGGWKADVFICQNEQELLAAYKSIKSNPVLIEEFIDKENELCVDGISINGGEEIYMPVKCNYLRFTAGAYGNYMTVSPFDDEELKKKIQALIRRTNYSGIFCIEFLITKTGEFKLLEVNFRHSTWCISSKVAGADLPLIWMKSELKGQLDTSGVTISPEPFTAMAELADFNDHVRHGDLSLIQWLRDFHNCPCTYFYHPQDRRPFFVMIKNAMKLLVKKILKK